MTDKICRPPADVRVEALAATQHDAFSLAQAVELGVSERVRTYRCAQGRWERMEPGVYRVMGSPPSWRQRLMGACLGSGGVASHRAAARLWDFDGVDDDIVEVTVPRNSGYRRNVAHRSDLEEVDVTIRDAIPVTTPARTLVDLGAVVTDDVLERALESALRTGLSLPRLQWRLDTLAERGRPGVAALRRVLARRPPSAAATESELETRFVQVLREAGLPEPVRQHVVREAGQFVARVDFAYPKRRLAIELDGVGPHTGTFQRDRSRQNRLVLLGWTVLRFTWADVGERPGEVVTALALAAA